VKEKTHDLNYNLTFYWWISIRSMFRVLGVHNFVGDLKVIFSNYIFNELLNGLPYIDGCSSKLALKRKSNRVF
jgi:hypothetical protein